MLLRPFGPYPDNEVIAQLDRYVGVPFDHIVVVDHPDKLALAKSNIAQAPYVGFDTESKPTFERHQPQTGPHVIQIATKDQVFLFRYMPFSHQVVADILQSRDILKLGFGLSNDRQMIKNTFNICANHLIDLGQVFRRLGYKQTVGVKGAVALTLGQHFHKPKHVTIANWANPTLTDQQMRYAADDASACLAVYEAIVDTAPQVFESFLSSCRQANLD